MPKVVDMQDRDPMLGALESMKRNMPAFLEMSAVVAEIHKRSYDEHIKAGFTAQQALVLCQKLTIT